MKNNKTSLSYRQVVSRYLPLDQFVTVIQQGKETFFNKEIRRSRTRAGMTSLFNNSTTAFTLIELLVVVLIIGILAAVALPQYQKAVDKARLSKLVAMVKSVTQAEEAYYLANGNYTDQWDELALSFPGTLNQTGKILSTEDWAIILAQTFVTAKDTKLTNIKILAFYQNTGWGDREGKITCYASVTSDYAKKLCKQVAPHYIGDNVGQDSIYIFD